jgi:hypothetical protein
MQHYWQKYQRIAPTDNQARSRWPRITTLGENRPPQNWITTPVPRLCSAVYGQLYQSKGAETAALPFCIGTRRASIFIPWCSDGVR